MTTEWLLGRRVSATRRYSVTGRLLVTGGLSAAAGQLDLIEKENNLVAALSIPNQDLLFLSDSGVVTYASLPVLGTIGGVRIVSGPDFTSNAGPEYATIRTYSFTVEATYPAIAAGGLISYSETLSISGGGPLFTVRSALRGPPQRQLIYERTPYMATQSGNAVGYLAYPAASPPIFPQWLKQSPRIGRTAPKWGGLLLTEFGVDWSYEYESPYPLVGVPTVRKWV